MDSLRCNIINWTAVVVILNWLVVVVTLNWTVVVVTLNWTVVVVTLNWTVVVVTLSDPPFIEVSLINNNILNLFNNMNSEVVFLAWKWLNSVHLSIVSGAKNAKITFVEKPKMNIFRFQEQKYGYIIIYCILDQTKLFREPLWVGHVSLYKEEHLKLRPFSWRKTYFDFKFLS